MFGDVKKKIRNNVFIRHGVEMWRIKVYELPITGLADEYILGRI